MWAYVTAHMHIPYILLPASACVCVCLCVSESANKSKCCKKCSYIAYVSHTHAHTPMLTLPLNVCVCHFPPSFLSFFPTKIEARLGVDFSDQRVVIFFRISLSHTCQSETHICICSAASASACACVCVICCVYDFI